MSPTVFLADPAVRLAGVRGPGHRRIAPDVRQEQPSRVHWGWLLVAVLLASALLGLGYLRTWPPLATVMSGSMSPTIDTGDMVLLKRLDRPARVGDIVEVDVPVEARSRFGYPPVVIHRITRIDAKGSVTTKGDAYAHADPFTVPRTSLTKKVAGTVPAAGRVIAFLGSSLGLMWLAGGGALLFGMPLLERYRDAQRGNQDERRSMQSALDAVTAELAQLRVERDAAREESKQRLAGATREAAETQQQLRLVTTAFEQLPAQIERAIAAAFAAVPPAPPPPPVPAAVAIAPPPRPPAPIRAPAKAVPAPVLFGRSFVPASQYKPPPTPDLMTALHTPADSTTWDASPLDPAGQALSVA